jgi:hypothetical protein
MTYVFTGGDLTPIAQRLLKRIQENQQDANALIDMAIICFLRGETQLARSMQALALQTQQVFHYPRPTLPIKIRALAILGLGDLMANSPFEFLIEQQPIALDLLYISPDIGLPKKIPEHDVLIVAIAESDSNQPLLAYLNQALLNWPHPVINRPNRIAQLARDTVCQLLAGIPQITLPPALRVTREALVSPPPLAGEGPGVRIYQARPQSEVLMNGSRNAVQGATRRPGWGPSQAAQRRNAPKSRLAKPQIVTALGINAPGTPCLNYPIIIRPIDSHAGSGLQKIEGLGELTGYLINSLEPDFFVAPFIDYRSPDGFFRKYRIILIQGAPYLCHLAISQRWMVHYLNADMLENAAHRAEEAQAMAEFNTTFALRHAAAFTAIYTKLGLDYVGIDCAETADGKLLIFEVDSNMVVHNMDSAEKFPYKKIQMPKLFCAFTQLLAQRSGKS